MPRTPVAELILPDGATLAEDRLTVKGGEVLSVALSGLAEGDRAEDFAVEMTVDGYTVDRLPNAPRKDGYAYDLSLHVYYDGRGGAAENYEHVYFYLSLEVLPDATEAPAPTLPYLTLDAPDRRSDGETTFDLTVSWKFEQVGGENPQIHGDALRRHR
jgi:hypothetical protein